MITLTPLDNDWKIARVEMEARCGNAEGTHTSAQTKMTVMIDVTNAEQCANILADACLRLKKGILMNAGIDPPESWEKE